MQRTITVSLDERQFHALVAAVATECNRIEKLTDKFGYDYERIMHLLDGYNAVRNAWYAQEPYPTPQHETAGDPPDWVTDIAIDHAIEERA